MIASPVQPPSHPAQAADVQAAPAQVRYAGPVLLTVSFVAIAVTALLGPSATEAPLGAHDNSATPPWHFDAAPAPWLVTTLLAISVIAACIVLWLGLSGRWRPRPKRLVAAGVLAAAAFGVLAPIGSADPLSYAADGRLWATGHDPWTTSPAQDSAHDPVEQAVEVPWQHVASVYGPLVTAEQAAASKIAGTNIALTVLILDVVGAATFIGAGLLLHAMAGDDAARRRAGFLWTANPLLWLQLVAGAHLDVLAAAAVLVAVALAARNRLAAGAFIGVATAIKAPAGLVWLAFAWSARRSRRAVVELAVSAGVVAGVAFAISGIGLIKQLSRASHLISLATPWRPVADVADPLLGHNLARHIIGLLALVLFVAIVMALKRLNPEVSSGTPAAVALALTLGYVLTAPYSLPWYDALPWVLLPLLAASRLDLVLIVHTAVLSLAYIPGRAAVVLHGAMHTVAFGMRDVVSPILLTGLLLALAVASTRHASRPARLA